MKMSCVLSLFICTMMVILSVQDFVTFHTLYGGWVNHIIKEENIFPQNVGNLLNVLRFVFFFFSHKTLNYRKEDKLRQKSQHCISMTTVLLLSNLLL